MDLDAIRIFIKKMYNDVELSGICLNYTGYDVTPGAGSFDIRAW